MRSETYDLAKEADSLPIRGIPRISWMMGPGKRATSSLF